MPIPDFQNLMLPMLQLAADGQEHRLSDMIEALAQQFELTEDDRAELLPSGGQARFDNRVGWARTHLGKALLLASPRRGWLRISERGRAALAQQPARIDMAFLSQYPEYVAFRSRGRAAENSVAAATAASTTSSMRTATAVAVSSPRVAPSLRHCAGRGRILNLRGPRLLPVVSVFPWRLDCPSRGAPHGRVPAECRS